jgi:hypothetical protein
VRLAHVHAEKGQFTVQAPCDALDVSTSGYYAWAKRRHSRTNRRAKRTSQVDAVRQAFHRSRGRYGSRRVHAELRARGHRISRRSVEELMRDQGLVARARRNFRATTDSKHEDPIAPNLLKRTFHGHPARSGLGRRRHRHRHAGRLAFPCCSHRPGTPCTKW